MKRHLLSLYIAISSLVCFSSCMDDVEITTGDAFNITENSASITCTIESDDFSMSDFKDFGVLYHTSKGTVMDGAGFEVGTTTYRDNSFTVHLYLGGLNDVTPKPGTKYYYCGYAVCGNDYYYGEVKSFTTPK